MPLPKSSTDLAQKISVAAAVFYSALGDPNEVPLTWKEGKEGEKGCILTFSISELVGLQAFHLHMASSLWLL